MKQTQHTTVHPVLATTAAHFEAGRKLVSTYIQSLPFDVSFQDYEGDIKNLHQVYAAPTGALWLLEKEGRYLGCSGVRKLEEGICELKRTYIHPELRGKGMGQLLLEKCLESGRSLGYQKMYLDTHLSMKPAIALYEKNGFKDIHAYCYNPMEATRYLGVDLAQWCGNT